MSINEVRDKLHLLIDEIDDEYVLRGFYRALVREKADVAARAATPAPESNAKPPRQRKTS